MSRPARGRVRRVCAAAVVTLLMGVPTAPLAVASAAADVTAADAAVPEASPSLAPEIAARLEDAPGAARTAPDAADPTTTVTFAGRLVMPDGVPFGGTSVWLSDAWRPSISYAIYVMPDENGSFSFEDVPPGRYVLDAFDPPVEVQEGYYPGGVSRQDAQTFDLVAGRDVTDVRFELVRGATIAGRVVVPEWLDVTSITVDARGVLSSWGYSTGKSVIANPDGTYLLEGLHPGDHDVSAVVQARGTVFYPGRRPVALTTSQTVTGIDLTLTGVPRFADVPAGAPFAAEIEWLAAEGITRGAVQADGSTVFDPTGPVRREAMAAFLYRAAGSPAFTAPTTSPFLDVATAHPFYAEIAWLSDAGVSTGTEVAGGREFRPTQRVTREAMAAFLYRLHHPA